LVVPGVVILLGISLVLFRRLTTDGPAVIGRFGALLVIAGAALELGAVWFFLRRRG
jgi:hypothetical protein